MNRPSRYHPVACCVEPLFAITAMRFPKGTPPRQASADMSLYIMFAGKIVLLALAFARLV